MKFGFHEMWKDEWQAWLVARDMSWSEMLSFLDYEGHGSLWYIWLKCWTYVRSLIAESLLLKLAHSIPYVIFLFLLLLKTKLPWLWKILFCCGYFVIFEYGVISRSYVFLLILLTLIVLELQSERYRSWMFVSCLILLVQTEVYGVLLGGTILLYLFLHGKIKLWSLSVMGFVISSAVFVWSVFPRDALSGKQDAVYRSAELSISSLFDAVVSHLSEVYLTATNLVASPILSVLAAMVVLLLLYTSLRADRIALISLGAYLLASVLFSWLIYQGGLRQWGSDFLIWFFLICLSFDQLVVDKDHWRERAILILLALQLVYSMIGIVREIREPFSHARDVAQFLKENVPQDAVIVGINPMEMTPVIGYSGKEINILPKGESMTYFQWLEKIYIAPQSELELYARYRKREGLIVLSDRPLPKATYPGLQSWKSWDGPSMKSEDYYLYTLSTR